VPGESSDRDYDLAALQRDAAIHDYPCLIAAILALGYAEAGTAAIRLGFF
jgi:hypothetical protein